MPGKAKHLAEGYHSITPYLIVQGAAQAIEFYKQAFGATELLRLTDATGRVRHAEVQIGDSVIMLADEPPNFSVMRGPQAFDGSSVQLFLYVVDVDAVAQRAITAGATVLIPVTDSEEDRHGGLKDPFGHIWWIATRIQDWSRAEIRRRFEANRKET